MRVKGSRLLGAVLAAMLVFIVSNAAATVVGMAADQWRNPIWWIAAAAATFVTAFVGVLLPGGAVAEAAVSSGAQTVATTPPGGGSTQAPPQIGAPPRSTRRSVSIVAALAIVVGLCGLGTAGGVVGVRYVAGWLTGSETGQERLVEQVSVTSGPLRLTVIGVEVTSHYTKVDLAAANGGDESLRLVKGFCTLTFADGTTTTADTLRGSWPEAVPPGTSVRGLLLFSADPGPDATSAALSFATVFGSLDGPTSITVRDIGIAAA